MTRHAAHDIVRTRTMTDTQRSTNMTTTYWIAVYDTDGDSDYLISADRTVAEEAYGLYASLDWSAHEEDGTYYAVELYRQDFPSDPWLDEDWNWFGCDRTTAVLVKSLAG